MPTTYSYEIWDGKQVLGHFVSLHLMRGKSVFSQETSILKASYGRKLKTIEIPITIRIVFDDGIDTMTRVVLDVRRKSKRQIDILKSNSFGGV